MATRLESKHRPTKRPMATATLDLNGNVLTIDTVPGRVPRLDERGYPTKLGVPDPVLVAMTTVDTTP